MFLGKGLRVLIQAAYFIIIARSLGSEQYGAFVSVTAFIQILSPFVGGGCGILMIKNVARNRSLFAEYLGNALFVTCASGLLFMVFVLAAARSVLPTTIPLDIVVLIAISDLVFAKLVECAMLAFQSLERLDGTAYLGIILSSTRLAGIAFLAISFQRPTAEQWSQVYLLTTVVTAALGVVWLKARIAAPKLALYRLKDEFAEGLYYCASLSAQTIYNDIDKTMLARMTSLDAAGIYAAAYRLIDVAFIPVRSLLDAAFPGYFRAGSKGIAGTVGYMKRLLPKAVIYAACSFVVLVVCAPVVRHVLGEEYSRTVEALRWLALLPLLKSMHYFLADALTGAGYQGLRTSIQGLVATFNILLNLWLIPAYSWRGAAASSLASDGLLVACLLPALLILKRREAGLSPIIADTAS